MMVQNVQLWRRYVRAVTAYAELMRADERAFLGYYQWQVYYGGTLLPEGYPARPPAAAGAGRPRHPSGREPT
jgi:hypothetical protein